MSDELRKALEADDHDEALARLLHEAFEEHGSVRTGLPWAQVKTWERVSLFATAGYVRALFTKFPLATPASSPPIGSDLDGYVLDVDAARLALWKAIQNIEIGNKWDDKLILDELRKLGIRLVATPFAPREESGGMKKFSPEYWRAALALYREYQAKVAALTEPPVPSSAVDEGVAAIIQKWERDKNHNEDAFDPECETCLILADLRALKGKGEPS